MATIRESITGINTLLSSLTWKDKVLYNVEKVRELYGSVYSSTIWSDLREKYNLLKETMATDTDDWTFVSESLLWLLYLLNLLSKENKKEEKGEVLLSISDQKTLSSLAQFLSVLGLYTNLDPFVGMATTKTPPIKRTDLPVAIREERLYKTLVVLVKCIKNPLLTSILLPELLTNIIAGLLQINYKPTSSLSISEKAWSREVFVYLLKNIPLPLIVRELLAIQSTIRKVGGGGGGQQMSWLRRGCGVLLSQVLMERNGVQFVLRGIFEASTGNTQGEVETATEVSENWRKCHAIAQILSSCPKQVKSVGEYYMLVCPQILALFGLPSEGIGRQFLRVAVSTLSMMLSKERELAMIHLITPLLKPLLILTDNSDFTVLSRDGFQEGLLNCLRILSRILAIIEPSSALLMILVSYLPLLFEIWRVTRNDCQSMSSLVKAVLISILKIHDTAIQLSFIKYLLHQDSMIHYSIEITFIGLKHGIVLRVVNSELIVEEKGEEDQLYYYNSSLMEDIGWCLNELLKEMKSLSMAVLLYCLEHMSSVLTKESHLQEEPSHLDDSTNTSSQVLLQWEEEQQTSSDVSFTNTLILYLLASLCESMNDHLQDTLTKSTTTIVVVSSLLHSLAIIIRAHAKWCSKGEVVVSRVAAGRKEESLTGGHVTLSIGFGLLSAILTMKEFDRSLWTILKSLLPYLETISDSYPQIELSECANQLRICIATLGAVVFDDKPNDKTTNTKASLIEELSPYDEALRDVQDPLIPVKGHGLRQLGKLAKNKDSQVLKNIDQVFTIFAKHMDHSDSYVYLAAVHGMVELSDVRPDLIIPHLCQEYGQFENNESTPQKRSLEWRVKLGETLVHVSRQIGDLLPKYSHPLLSSVLSNTKDSDPLIRASALANLAQICNNLKWSFTSIENEVIECLCQILRHDNEGSVKRGAIQVITQLFKGLETNIDKVLHGKSLLKLYHLLKETESSSDHLTQTHAQAALGELDTVMKQLLFQEQTLTKKISILDSMI